MARKVFMVPLDIPLKPITITCKLPAGTEVVDFGIKEEVSMVQSADGPSVKLLPFLVCVGKPESIQVEDHSFTLAVGDSEVPDIARFIGNLGLPDGTIVNIFENGDLE